MSFEELYANPVSNSRASKQPDAPEISVRVVPGGRLLGNRQQQTALSSSQESPHASALPI